MIQKLTWLVEVMGGVEQTKQYLFEALNNKKHVVTANKDLMAIHGAEAFNGCSFRK